MNELTSNNLLLEKIQNQSVKKRVKREMEKLEEKCSLISIDIDNYNKNNYKYIISIMDNTNNYIYSIIFNDNYPFVPPNVKINYKLYSDFLKSSNVPFKLNLKKIYKIDCLCCNTITCHSNWSPGFTTNHLIKEIRQFKSYKRNLINKLIADKIKIRYLIDDIDLDSWLL